jgi:hypothetical protein
MSEHYEAFNVGELRTVSHTCPKCQTVLTFSIVEDRYGLPQKCPTCGESMEQAVKAFGMYRTFYRLVTEGNLPIRLQTEILAGSDD